MEKQFIIADQIRKGYTGSRIPYKWQLKVESSFSQHNQEDMNQIASQVECGLVGGDIPCVWKLDISKNEE